MYLLKTLRIIKVKHVLTAKNYFGFIKSQTSKNILRLIEYFIQFVSLSYLAACLILIIMKPVNEVNWFDPTMED